MNRDIEFRGKTKEGKWIYGYYRVSSFMPERNEEVHLICWKNECEFEVLPETVGQYIGREDLNKIKVFHNDIVKFSVWNTKDGNSPLGDNCWKVGVIRFECGEFYIRTSNKNESCIYKVDYPNLIVIGNFIDNPELLKWK